MSPERTQYFQTYVDQYVPLPFETIATAMGTRQKIYDDTKAASDAMLLTNVDALEVDKAMRDQILNEYTDKISTMVEQSGGDYSKLRADVSSLAMDLNKNLTRGNLGLIQEQYNRDVAYQKQLQELQTKGFDKGGITGQRLQELLSFTRGSYDRSGGIARDGRYSGLNPVAQYDMDNRLKELLSKWAADGGPMKSAPGEWKEEGGVIFKKRRGKWEKADANEIYQASMSFLTENPMFAEESKQMLQLGYSPETIRSLQEQAARRAASIYGYTKTEYDEDLRFVPQHLTGAGAAKDPDKGYMYITTSGRDVSIDPDQLRNKANTIEEQLSSLQSELSQRTGNDLSTQSRRKDLENQIRDLNYQKKLVKSTLEAMADKGGFDWNSEYRNYINQYDQNTIQRIDPAANSEQRNQIVQQARQELPTFEQFKQTILEGSYYSLTPGLDKYVHPIIKDTDNAFLLDRYVDRFNNIASKLESRNIAQENTVVIGGKKTYGKVLTDTWNTNLNKAAPELLFTDGSQFQLDDPRFSDVDWSKDARVELLRDFAEGRPQIQVTPKNKKGVNTESFNLIVDRNSPLINDIIEIGLEMYENAPASFSSFEKVKENRDQGAYIYGAAKFPEIMDADIETKPIGVPFNIPLGQSSSYISVTPKKEGSVLKYEAFLLNSKTGATQPIQGQEIIYNTPDEITAAIGRFMIEKTLERKSILNDNRR